MKAPIEITTRWEIIGVNDWLYDSQMVWDSSRSILSNVSVKEKIMYFTAETIGPKGGKIMHIFTFHDLPDKTVRQWWQQSTDGGKTWNSVWDSIYKKKTR